MREDKESRHVQEFKVEEKYPQGHSFFYTQFWLINAHLLLIKTKPWNDQIDMYRLNHLQLYSVILTMITQK